MNDMSLNLEERLRRIPAEKNVATAVITATKPIPEYAVGDSFFFIFQYLITHFYSDWRKFLLRDLLDIMHKCSDYECSE